MKIIFILPLFLPSCFATSKKPNKDEIIFSKFPEEQSVNGQAVLKFESKIASLYIKDSFLLLRHTPDSYDSLLSFVNLKNYPLKVSFSKISFGGDSGQILSPLSCTLYQDSIFSVQDISTNKIVLFNLDRMRSNGAFLYREVSLPKFFYSICPMNSGVVIANGDNLSLKELQKIDLKTGKIISEFGEYNHVPKGESPLGWKNKHESFLFIKPGGDRIISAARYTDKIELFDLISLKKIRTVIGPENFSPELGYSKVGGMNRITRNPKTKYAFVGGTTTDRFIYLLYSGNKSDGPNEYYGKSIFVYSWDGTPVKRINLNKYVSGIVVSKDGRELYTIDPVGEELLKMSITL